MVKYLTQDLPGIGGLIKEKPEDFYVEEIPLYKPQGYGEHTFFEIEKVGISTFQALRHIAQALGVSRASIGYAGLKDAQAIARQVMSVEGISPEAVRAISLPNIRILWAEQHTNKLKIGHLKGNRFVIRIRDVKEEAIKNCQQIMEVLVRRGVPNYFGEQRFGHRKDSHLLGKALVQRDIEGMVRLYLGHSSPSESQAVQEARRLFDAGKWPEAFEKFPKAMADERNALRTLLLTKGDFRKAYYTIPKKLRRFFVSAYQSHLFNKVLEERLETVDRLFPGDLAYKHDTGAAFLVEDAEKEQPRAERFEISPSGPLYGYKLLLASGQQGELERRILKEEGLSLESFRLKEGLKVRGERRPLRFPISEVKIWYDEGIVLSFTLPRGSYATNVLQEIIKSEVRGWKLEVGG
ncbi:MAG: tRNA pseudouridine(13) synthase TruD [Anaerolineae bacterium]